MIYEFVNLDKVLLHMNQNLQKVGRVKIHNWELRIRTVVHETKHAEAWKYENLVLIIESLEIHTVYSCILT